MKDFFTKWPKTKSARVMFWSVAILIETLIIFQAGMVVGYHKANFSMNWANNYRRNFESPGRQFNNGFMGEYTTAHGTFGKVIGIASSTIIVAGSDNTEKKVLIDGNTIVRSLRDNVSINDIKVNDFIIAIGTPTDVGELKATFIRIMPAGDPGASSTGAMMKH
jgi:hypothetical protein